MVKEGPGGIPFFAGWVEHSALGQRQVPLAGAHDQRGAEQVLEPGRAPRDGTRSYRGWLRNPFRTYKKTLER